MADERAQARDNRGHSRRINLAGHRALELDQRPDDGQGRGHQVGRMGPRHLHAAVRGGPVVSGARRGDDDRGRTRVRHEMGICVLADRRRRRRGGSIRGGKISRQVVRRANRRRAIPCDAAANREARLPDNPLPAVRPRYSVQRVEPARGRISDHVLRLFLGDDDRHDSGNDPVRLSGRRAMASAVAKVFPRAAANRRVDRMRRNLPPLDPRQNRRLARDLQIFAMESKHHRDHLPVTLDNASAAEMSTVERLKSTSEGLFYVHSTHDSRRTMRAEIDALSARQAETISEHAKEISKHFGIYKQRERNESGKKDGDFIFMVRVKIPAGELTPAQWIALDAASDRYADGSIRLTARQGVQFHYVRGHNLSALIREINASVSDNGYQLTTLGACGDVNRNTVASPIDDLDVELPLDTHQLARAVAREMAPRSSAYYQVFLSDESGQQIAPLNAEEPIYSTQYLPRKFKVGFAHPHDNSVDLLTQDVGFLPRVDKNGRKVIGYDLYSGGGM